MRRASLSVLLLLPVLSLLPAEVCARTWYVNIGGTGDAPTPNAAVDSAAAGDSVVVGPGTYLISALILKPGMVLVSEDGPLATILQSDGTNYVGIDMDDNTAIVGLWIKGFEYSAVNTGLDSDVLVANNILQASIDITISNSTGDVRNNLFLGGISMDILIGQSEVNYMWIHNNIVLSEVMCTSGYAPLSFCNDFFPHGPACMIDLSSFNLDPAFCGVSGSGDYFLQADSPCAPGNDPGGDSCGLIGPLPVACGTVATEQHTWGAIKSLYREAPR